MGVPSLYRWLVNKYPRIVVDVNGNTPSTTTTSTTDDDDHDMEFDHLYLDMNGIIHPCFHPDSSSDNVYFIFFTSPFCFFFWFFWKFSKF